MAEVKPADKKVKLRNKTKSVIVSGPIRIMPGAEIEIFESKISEGMKRIIGTALEKIG